MFAPPPPLPSAGQLPQVNNSKPYDLMLCGVVHQLNRREQKGPTTGGEGSRAHHRDDSLPSLSGQIQKTASCIILDHTHSKHHLFLTPTFWEESQINQVQNQKIIKHLFSLAVKSTAPPPLLTAVE